MVVEYDISLTLYSKEYLQEIIYLYHHSKPVKVHIKVDTGMNRLGFKSKKEFEDVLAMCPKHIFKVEGVLTHFATADDPSLDGEYEKQLNLFKDIIKDKDFKYIHAHNSASMMYHDATLTNLSRIGLRCMVLILRVMNVMN